MNATDPTDPTDPSGPSGESFDPFERRVHDQLNARASILTAPRDGLDRIHSRVARRRRTRLTGWAAAASLVLLAGITTVVLRTTTTDSSPFIDTTTDTTPAPTESASLPLLSFTGPVVQLADIRPGRSYRVLDGGVADGASLLVTADALPMTEVTPGADVVRVGAEAVPIVRFAASSHTVLTVTWRLTDGATAKLTLDREPLPADPVPILQAALDRIEEVSATEFLASARRAPVDKRPLDALVLDGGTEGVSVDSLNPTVSLLYWIDEPSLGSPAELKIVGSHLYGGNPYLGKGEAAVVRNATGVFVPADGPGLDGQRRDLLAWEADGFVVELRMPGSDSRAVMVAFANSLRLASDDEWVELILGE